MSVTNNKPLRIQSDGKLDQAAPRRRGRPKIASDEVQAAHIVDTARKLFLQRGYGKTTMNDVAAQCRASKRTLYRHFPGKTELLAAVIDLHRHTMLALPGDYDSMPLAVALEKIFLIDIDSAADIERTAFLKLMIVESTQYPEIGELMRRLGADKSKTLLVEWMETQKALGKIGIDDVKSAAQILMDMVFGAVISKTGNGPEWPGQDERTSYLRQCIRIFVNGVGTRSAS
jgi:TetR/AcrR family transcriptional repressor of mexJK operon